MLLLGRDELLGDELVDVVEFLGDLLVLHIYIINEL